MKKVRNAASELEDNVKMNIGKADENNFVTCCQI